MSINNFTRTMDKFLKAAHSMSTTERAATIEELGVLKRSIAKTSNSLNFDRSYDVAEAFIEYLEHTIADLDCL